MLHFGAEPTPAPTPTTTSRATRQRQSRSSGALEGRALAANHRPPDSKTGARRLCDLLNFADFICFWLRLLQSASWCSLNFWFLEAVAVTKSTTATAESALALIFGRDDFPGIWEIGSLDAWSRTRFQALLNASSSHQHSMPRT
jgi:hypothetical protein